jgi:hypothetical protein
MTGTARGLGPGLLVAMLAGGQATGAGATGAGTTLSTARVTSARVVERLETTTWRRVPIS